MPCCLGRGAVFCAQMANDHPQFNPVEQPFGLGHFGQLADIIDKADHHRHAKIGH